MDLQYINQMDNLTENMTIFHNMNTNWVYHTQQRYEEEYFLMEF